MNPSTGELLRAGLVITVLGMGLVFAALVLLWGLIQLLSVVFRDKVEPAPQVSTALDEAEAAEKRTALEAEAALTGERARSRGAGGGGTAGERTPPTL